MLLEIQVLMPFNRSRVQILALPKITPSTVFKLRPI